MLEPSVGALGGAGRLRTAKRLFLATRPMFFPASGLPVLLGTAWGYRDGGEFDAVSFALAFAATVCVHAGVNVLNDVFDELSGTDRINEERIFPFTGGSRFIQNEVMTLQGMARWGVVLLAVAALFGLLLVAQKGLPVLLLGFAGIALGLLYSMPPAALCGRGVGEAAVGAGFGILPVMGAAWLQSGRWEVEALLLSLPVSLWVALILLANEVPDIRADAEAGKRTLAVRLGPSGTARLYLALQLLAVAPVGLLVLRASLPPAALVVPLAGITLALSAARRLAAAATAPVGLVQAIKATLTIHALGTLWLAGWAWPFA